MSTEIALLTTSRAQARAIRLAQIEKEQQLEDAQALSLISSLSCELSDVNVPWADLDGLSWTGSHLRKATEKKDRKVRGMPYGWTGKGTGKEMGMGRRVLSERVEKLVGAVVGMKPSASVPTLAFGEITNTNINTAEAEDKNQTIRAPAIANILAQTRVSTPTITPPLVVRNSSTTRLYKPDIERLIQSRERARGRGRSPVKAIFCEADMKMRDRVISRAEKVPQDNDGEEPEEAEREIPIEYTGGAELCRTPSYSYLSDPVPIVEEVEVEDDMQTPTPGMFRGKAGYFSTVITTTTTTIETDFDGEATIRLPPAKKSRPLPIPLPDMVFPTDSNASFLASVGVNAFPLSAPSTNTAFPLMSPTTSVPTAPRRARAKSTLETKPPVSLLNPTVNLKRGKTLSLVGPRPMIERRPTPVPGVGVGVEIGGGKRKRS
ncbi:hypothetical protein VNI00_015754 [Paramarasmius palmivorus]|uniref:Uncharacterized protein n=1 Tax=Paramarasmius palmivorus TaxID=297713 RepID=A0AAW0BJB0_9AGAR